MESSQSISTEPTSLLQKFDAHIKQMLAILDTTVEKDYKTKLMALDELSTQFNNYQNDNELMKKKLRELCDECGRLMQNLNTSNRLLYNVNKNKKRLETELDITDQQIDNLNTEFESANPIVHQLGSPRLRLETEKFDQIGHEETTESVLSDISYSSVEESPDFDNNFEDASKCRGEKLVDTEKRKRMSVVFNFDVLKEKTETISTTDINQIIATTTVTIQNGENINLKSVIESKPTSCPSPTSRESSVSDSDSHENNQNFSNTINASSALSRLNNRAHTFVQKSIVIPEMCYPCGKNVKFNRVGVKCLDCKATAHLEHKDEVPLPCIPMTSTLNKNGGRIIDYSPMVNGHPMVPALVIHCVNEIEKRGFDTVGLYRVPSLEKHVKALKEKFCKGVPNLSDVNIHVLCSCLKDFLRFLDDPLIPHHKRKIFIDTVQTAKDETEHRLYQAISLLPQSNQNTLAYLILHLQKVATTPNCKMPISNLSKIFGPTIVGYSSENCRNLYFDCELSNKVVEEMLKLPSDYWSKFLDDMMPQQTQNSPVKQISSLPFQPSHTAITKNINIFGSSTKKRYLESPQSAKAARIKQMESTQRILQDN